MEKRWLGGVGLSLLLVLLVFGVGYSSGNSPTGYQFFDIFKKPKVVLPAGAEASRATCSCNINYQRLDSSGESPRAVLGINSRRFSLGVGDTLMEGDCFVELFDIDSQRNNAISLEVNNQRVSLWPRQTRNVNVCLEEYGSGCDCNLRLVRFNGAGNPIFRINGETYELSNGDDVVSGNCEVNLLSSNSERRTVSLEVNGQAINLRTDYYG